MALPVFGLFLQRLFADPDFAPMGQSQFEAPANFNVELDCDNVKKQQQVNPFRQREY
jgi:hypothetical protein